MQAETTFALEDGADEIDVVIAVGKLKAGLYNDVSPWGTSGSDSGSSTSTSNSSSTTSSRSRCSTLVAAEGLMMVVFAGDR